MADAETLPCLIVVINVLPGGVSQVSATRPVLKKLLQDLLGVVQFPLSSNPVMQPVLCLPVGLVARPGQKHDSQRGRQVSKEAHRITHTGEAPFIPRWNKAEVCQRGAQERAHQRGTDTSVQPCNSH